MSKSEQKYTEIHVDRETLDSSSIEAPRNMKTRTVSNLILRRSAGRRFDEDGNGNDGNGFLF
jgi:hypothetical protein